MLLRGCALSLASAISCVALATRTAPHRPRDSPSPCQFYDCPVNTLPDPVTGAIVSLHLIDLLAGGIRYCQYAPPTNIRCQYDVYGALIGTNAVCNPYAICILPQPCAVYDCPPASLAGYAKTSWIDITAYGDYAARVCYYGGQLCEYKLDTGQLAEDYSYPFCFERAQCIQTLPRRREVEHNVKLRDPEALGRGLAEAGMVLEGREIEDVHQPW